MTKIVRMMAVHNEIDVLSQNIDWYRDAGFHTVVVDNGSVDGSYEYCEECLSRGTIDALERYPTDEFEWIELLGRMHELARKQAADWLVLTAPDEFFEPADGDDLGTAIRRDIAAGYNLIKFYNMEFWMTEQDDPNDPNPLTRIRHYSCYDVDMYRAYPNIEGLELLTHYGHRPVFPPGCPENPSAGVYVSRHYKLRNAAQAARKIQRIRPTRAEPGVHTHYLQYRGGDDFLVPAARLHRYDFDHRWNFESVYDGKRGLPRATRMPVQPPR